MNGVLLDTNVLSEVARTQPNAGVIEFLTSVENAYISVMSIHELTYGIERLEAGTKRRIALTRVIDSLLATYQANILDIGEAEAKAAANMRANRESQGRTLHLIDSLIAATAIVNGLSIATRNVSDFQELGAIICNPWN